MQRRTFLAGAGLFGLALAGCSPKPAASSTTQADNAFVATLPPTVVGQLNTMPAKVRDAYVYALRQPESLAYIPCYCGCVSSGHTSNLDCFVRSGAGTANPTLDGHGLGCDLCVDIALDVKTQVGQGRTLAKIRGLIDMTYGNAGPGTKTPLPPTV